MPTHSPSSFSSGLYDSNSNNGTTNNNNNSSKINDDSSDPNLGIGRNFIGRTILQAQAQGQVPQAPNSNAVNPSVNLIAHFLSLMNSSVDSNGNGKMSGNNNQMTLSSNATPPVANNNVNVNVSNVVNSQNNNGNNASQGNQNSMLNFPLLNPNIFRHLQYDPATAALLMNPQAAAHAAVAAQAAVASVAQQFVSAQQQPQQHHHQQQQQQSQQQSQQQQPQRISSQAVPTSVQSNKVKPPPQHQSVNVNVPSSSFSMNSLNNHVQANTNVNGAPSVGPVSKPNSPVTSQDNSNRNVNVNVSANNQIGVNQALAVLSSAGLINGSQMNQATAQAVAAAAVAASNIKLQQQSQPHGHPPTAHSPHPRTHSHGHARSQATHSNVVGVGVGPNNNKNKRAIMNPVPSLPNMPPPSKNTPIGLQTMMAAAMPTLRAGAKKPILSVSAGSALGNPLENMRNWSLSQLEAHVHLLQKANQAVPQPLALLLADARRKEEKRNAKRVANRKSACTSRARKKALVEEMTRTNAKLKRQALILSLLPDLVVAITVDGEITFCSAQVERVLRHSVDGLVGSNLKDILLPGSKEALSHLIDVLVTAEANERNNRSKGEDNGASSSSSGSSNVAIVSEQSFPPSVVKVMGPDKNSSSGQGNNNAKNDSTEKGKNASAQSSSSLENSSSQSGSDEDRGARRVVTNSSNNTSGAEDRSSSSPTNGNICDDTSSAEAKMRASEALNRNVQHHKDQLSKDKPDRASSHKDDVTGASVTANNADARLSSLQHCPKYRKALSPPTEKKPETKKAAMVYENLEEQSSASSDSLLSEVEEKTTGKTNVTTTQQDTRTTNENESEDSGYREGSESFPSREDSGSSGDDSSTNQRNGRKLKPLAPTCNVCLIRDDLTTIWCEVTSSIRTRSLSDETMEPSMLGASPKPIVSASSSDPATSTNGGATENKSDAPAQENTVKELLLCLRPIREGEEKVTEEFRFKPKNANVSEDNFVPEKQTNEKVHIQNSNSPSDAEKKPVAGSSTTSNNIKDATTSAGAVPLIKRPMKKRPFSEMTPPKSGKNEEGKVRRQTMAADVTSATEQSVVESLMLMSHKKKDL